MATQRCYCWPWLSGPCRRCLSMESSECSLAWEGHGCSSHERAVLAVTPVTIDDDSGRRARLQTYSADAVVLLITAVNIRQRQVLAPIIVRLTNPRSVQVTGPSFSKANPRARSPPESELSHKWALRARSRRVSVDERPSVRRKAAVPSPNACTPGSPKGRHWVSPLPRAAVTAASTCSRVVGYTGTGLSAAPTSSSISVHPRMTPSAPAATNRSITRR